MKIAYYPGCSGEGTAVEYDRSTRAVCRALDIELQDVPDWSCCGSTPAHATSPVLSAALSARNLRLAADAGAGCVLTPCPSCLSNMRHAAHNMQDGAFLAEVNGLLDRPAGELPPTYSVLQYICENRGLEDISRRVTHPLEGMKVAAYYGCLMVRPSSVMQFDDPENPMSLDNLLRALGAEPVQFPFKTECCGASHGVPRSDITAGLSGRILASAMEFGADAVVTACPLCQMNLDLRQKQSEKAARRRFGLPVFYYTQLLAYAFGLPGDAVCLERLAVDPAPFFSEIGKRRDKRNAESTGGAR